MDYNQPGSFSSSDNSGLKSSPFHGLNIQQLVPSHLGKQNAALQHSGTRYQQNIDVSRVHLLPNGMELSAGPQLNQQHQFMNLQQLPCKPHQSHQQLHQQQQQAAASNVSQPSAIHATAPALNRAAREQLVQAITLQEEISPAAQSALLHLIASMVSVEDLVPSGPSDASQLISQQDHAAPSSPIKSSSAISSGAQLLPAQNQAPALAGTAVLATAQQGNIQQQLPAADQRADELSTAAAATAFAQLSQTKHLPNINFDEQAPASPVADDLGTGKLQSSKSNTTYKARALAAAAGSVRPGPAGSTLRLAGAICRSSSGSLVDALLNEAARAESGLLTAGLARSDSLPDTLPSVNVAGALGATSGAVAAALDAAHAAGGMDSVKECLKDIAMLDSVRDFDLPLTLSGLPSLSFIMEQHSDILHLDEAGLAAAAAAHLHGQAAQKASAHKLQLQQQPTTAEPVSSPVVTDHHKHNTSAITTEQHMHGSSTAAASAQDPPTPGFGQRALRRPPSFTFRAAAALFSPQEQDMYKLQQQQQQEGQQDVCADVSTSAFATHLASTGLHPPSLLHPSDTYHLLPARQQPQHPLRPSLSALRVASFQRRVMLQQQQHGAAADLGAFGSQLPGTHAADELPVQQAHPGLHVPGGFQQLLNPADTLDGLLGQVNQELMAEAGIRQYAALQFGTMDSMETPTAAAAAPAAAHGFGATSSRGNVAPQGYQWQQQRQGGGPTSVFAGMVGWSEASPVGVAGFGTAGTQQGAAPPAGVAGGSQEVVRYSRVITCKTYLKRLNITQPMAEHLLPYHNLNAPAQVRPAAAEDDDSPRGAAKLSSTYELLFKEEVTVVDGSGGRFRVQYEGVSCNQQKHLRLTSGWRDYIRAHAVEVGDTIVFERRGEERRVLYVSVVKGDGPGQPDGVPAAKRKRVSRAQAVQRLD